MDNKPNVFNMNNININAMMNTPLYGNRRPLNPILSTFENNRAQKTDFIEHYAIGFSNNNLKYEKYEDIDYIRKDILDVDNGYCIMGFSKQAIHFQYYNIDGELVASYYINRAAANKENVKVTVKLTKEFGYILIKKKKEYFSFILPFEISKQKGVSVIGDRNQETKVTKIINGIKNKELFCE